MPLVIEETMKRLIDQIKRTQHGDGAPNVAELAIAEAERQRAAIDAARQTRAALDKIRGDQRK